MERGMRKELTGVVVSNKMEKTCVVAIQTWKIVPKYGKRVRSTRKVKAHDEDNSARTGDVVRIVESRPISRDKRWRVAEIVERSKAAGGDLG
ncbi:MAG: 30S ribosomal protein S17 [Bacillota bacterium]|jgi:small subunit ribosomal protein S17